MTPLEQRIREDIQRDGPISVERYMALCLFDPDFGYYTTREPFGVSGDFTTAPEVSQMFGEMLGAWWVSARGSLNLPGMALAEIGPGRGTLMADMLRTISKLGAAMPQVHMVEASPRLTQAQRENLADAGTAVSWHAGPQSLPDVPLGIIANELFDAIPAAQYVKAADGWFERHICIGADSRLEFCVGGAKLDKITLPAGHPAQSEGQIFEAAPARVTVLQSLACRIKSHGGFALIIDYGHAESGFGDTLQAVRSHEYACILDNPGEADLTSHVDFSALADAARQVGLFVSKIVNQRDFLNGCGIQARAAKLRPSDPASIDSALKRLAAHDEMGSLFKVLCISSAPVDLPPLKIRH